MMQIIECYKDLALLSEHGYRNYQRDGDVRELCEDILEEHVMDIYINEILTMKVICLPEHLADLTLGRLLTEGIIRSSEDVEQIHICEYGKRSRVFLRGSDRRDSRSYVETTPTCCTGNRVLNDYFVTQSEVMPVKPITVKRDWIFSLADTFASGSPLHEKTWATHSCILARGGTPVFTCEDLGRHNALDKVIGHALRNDIPLDECIVYTSGRVPTDMVIKTIRAGIPVLVSKAAPTAQAIDLAREYGLTLICAARRDRMKLLTGTISE